MRNEYQLQIYYRDVRRELPCSGKDKKQIFLKIRTSIDAFLQENPNATMKDIEMHFGSAKTIASAYLDNMDSVALLKVVRTRKTIKRTVFAVAAVALLLWGSIVGWAAIREWRSTHGYMSDIVTEESP